MRHFILSGLAIVCLACGGATGNPLVDGGKDTGGGGDDGNGGGDGMVDTGVDTGPTCENLECNIVNCGAGMPEGTTITGKVYDPAGARPIYNAFVYVPNRPLDPIASGPGCTACPAVASGKPLVSAVTDATGTFKITNAPSGSNIPLVLQVGKWRRRITIPAIAQCMVNSLGDPQVVRLPKKQAEGGADDNIPLIALALAPCDWLECFLQRTVGLDPAEFGAPGSNARVHLYRGLNSQQQFAATPGDAYALYGNVNELKKYDAVLGGCECQPVDRTRMGTYPMAYANMKAYLEAGGRAIGTHYHYNWYAAPSGPSDFQAQAPWAPNSPFTANPYGVDDSFPRGTAFRDWLQGVGVTTTPGQISLMDTRHDVNGLNGGMKGRGGYANTTQWMFHPQNQTLYLAFNAPTTSMMQCGRAAFSDMHVTRGTGGGQFPAYCSGITGFDNNERAMEFLLFDALGCVQDDTKPPVTPPTQ